MAQYHGRIYRLNITPNEQSRLALQILLNHSDCDDRWTPSECDELIGMLVTIADSLDGKLQDSFDYTEFTQFLTGLSIAAQTGYCAEFH